jgi:hypothetical protein
MVSAQGRGQVEHPATSSRTKTALFVSTAPFFPAAGLNILMATYSGTSANGTTGERLSTCLAAHTPAADNSMPVAAPVADAPKPVLAYCRIGMRAEPLWQLSACLHGDAK